MSGSPVATPKPTLPLADRVMQDAFVIAEHAAIEMHDLAC